MWPQLPVFLKVVLTEFRKAKASRRKEGTKAQSEGYQGTGEKKRVNSGERDRGQRCISEAKEGGKYVQEGWGGNKSAAGEATKGITASRKQNLNRFSTSEDFAVQKSIYVQGKYKTTCGSTGFRTPPAACRRKPHQSTRTQGLQLATLLFTPEVGATFFGFQTL